MIQRLAEGKMKLNIKIKEVLKNFENQKRKDEQDIKNIDKNLDINIPNPITQTKNLLLKINENVTLKEEFETFQLINYYNKKEYIKQQNKYLLLNSMQ